MWSRLDVSVAARSYAGTETDKLVRPPTPHDATGGATGARRKRPPGSDVVHHLYTTGG